MDFEGEHLTWSVVLAKLWQFWSIFVFKMYRGTLSMHKNHSPLTDELLIYASQCIVHLYILIFVNCHEKNISSILEKGPLLCFCIYTEGIRYPVKYPFRIGEKSVKRDNPSIVFLVLDLIWKHIWHPMGAIKCIKNCLVHYINW